MHVISRIVSRDTVTLSEFLGFLFFSEIHHKNLSPHADQAITTIDEEKTLHAGSRLRHPGGLLSLLSGQPWKYIFGQWEVRNSNGSVTGSVSR